MAVTATSPGRVHEFSKNLNPSQAPPHTPAPIRNGAGFFDCALWPQDKTSLLWSYSELKPTTHKNADILTRRRPLASSKGVSK
jgi:hypothetical protein